jgi:hypothetical protein
MANQVGQNVLYQPTVGEWPTGYYQHAAIITGWNEATQLANLLVFPDGATYTIAKNQVKEGTEDGQFLPLGATSRSTETQKQRQQQDQEIFRGLSGV